MGQIYSTVYSICKQKPDVYTVASASAVTDLDLKRKFRLYLVQCGRKIPELL